MRLLIGLSLLLVIVVSVAASSLFVLPQTGEIGPVEAVVQLSGEEYRRDVAVELVEDGHAPVLVLSLGPDSICRGGLEYEVICFEPDPVNTRGEAAAIGELVDRHGWATIAVVTSRHHLTRAVRTVRRCTDAEVRMVDAGTRLQGVRAWAPVVAREAAAIVAGIVLTPDC